MKNPNSTSYYDCYFSSGLYKKRYPKANPWVLQWIRSELKKYPKSKEATIIDYGCGNGRYLFPLLDSSIARFIGFDTSKAAIAQLKKNIEPIVQYRVRTQLFDNEATFYKTVIHQKPIILVMLLFGVLSHIEGKNNRIQLLEKLAKLLTDNNGCIVISVPNRWRRFPVRQLKQYFGSYLDSFRHSDIFYQRHYKSHKMTFFYHLYTLKDLENELRCAGLIIESVAPESIFPEKWITSCQLVYQLNHWLLTKLPPTVGYGLLVTAKRATSHVV
ncbi:methyltransferase domain-containing protein [Endozoicomonas sp. SM1973]|uniref:Methyltransferase domain-containing protein n=1 Tax=Spartinivicinus marinus TaxID=2994442 RepID=A0A853I7F0_9GAMM|nr:methyltransferase domain-containing protein [Spartinivicinus marinus]MCX4029560.1 methyltransferase domain-containing protein [Spartinivicinus marinus]NYZ65135.1 methyltransferase domain-containing protein [Spartinivicinus marinus]